MANIITSGALLPSTADTPLDARARIANLNAVESIDNPYTGMIFYCTGTGKHYKVKTLKSVSIGGGTGYAVGTYEEFGAQQTAPSWGDISDKPSTFPPSGHTHTVEDITKLPDLSGMTDLEEKKHTHGNKAFLDGLSENSFYSKSEIDSMFGYFEAAANAILGEEL